MTKYILSSRQHVESHNMFFIGIGRIDIQNKQYSNNVFTSDCILDPPDLI